MRKLLVLLGMATLLLAGVVVARTVTHRRVTEPVTPVAEVSVPERAVERLASAVRIPTVSHEDAAAFRDLHAHLETAFPRVHARLGRETVRSHSLLYTWQGNDPSLAPILLMGHLDVVPIEPGTEASWQEDPFGGRIAGGYVWGRGAIDNKSAVLGTLEAVEMLLGEGFQPARTLYLAYGHDEEVGGTAGARQIAALLRSRGVRLEMVLDEGGGIGEGLLPGVAVPVALVGIAEKGFLSIALSARTAGGHSSMPPRESAIGILSAAIARLEASPMPARLELPVRRLFDAVGPYFPLPRRVALANLWLTEPLVVAQLARTSTTNAMVRTTAAPTIFRAGTKDNVLAGRAAAVVNFRILPGDSAAAVVAHVRRAIDDPRVTVEMAGGFSAEPSEVSSTSSWGYRVLERTIRSVAPDVVVAPSLVAVATDARHYTDLCANVFRFLPLRLTPEDLARIHGLNERISVGEYQNAVRFYRQLMRNATAPP